jgi:ABC-2 type transport system permease protein
MNTLIITRREFAAFLASPSYYIIWAAYLFVIGLVFFFTVVLRSYATLAQVIYSTGLLFLIIVPLLSSRLLARDAYAGNLELLLTTPVRDWEIVVGKFLAAFLLLIVMVVSTLIHLFLLTSFGHPDFGVVLSGYVGVLLLGVTLISLGMLASALSTHLIIAAMLSVAFSLFFWLIGNFAMTVEGRLAHIFTYLSIYNRFTDFTLGLITVNNLIYFLSITSIALFLTTWVIQLRR